MDARKRSADDEDDAGTRAERMEEHNSENAEHEAAIEAFMRRLNPYIESAQEKFNRNSAVQEFDFKEISKEFYNTCQMSMEETKEGENGNESGEREDDANDKTTTDASDTEDLHM